MSEKKFSGLPRAQNRRRPTYRQTRIRGGDSGLVATEQDSASSFQKLQHPRRPRDVAVPRRPQFFEGNPTMPIRLITVPTWEFFPPGSPAFSPRWSCCSSCSLRSPRGIAWSAFGSSSTNCRETISKPRSSQNRSSRSIVQL